MARGYVRPYRLTIPSYLTWNRRSRVETRYAGRVEAQGVVVWRDDGWKTLGEAMTKTAALTQAFGMVEAKGQSFRSWDAIVEDAAAEL